MTCAPREFSQRTSLVNYIFKRTLRTLPLPPHLVEAGLLENNRKSATLRLPSLSLSLPLFSIFVVVLLLLFPTLLSLFLGRFRRRRRRSRKRVSPPPPPPPSPHHMTEPASAPSLPPSPFKAQTFANFPRNLFYLRLADGPGV